MSFKDKLQQVRREKKFSQEDVAVALNISRQAVAKWESGLTYPDIDNIILLSELFCVTIDSLLKEDSACSKVSIVSQSTDKEELIEFLLEAGRRTYAGKGAEVEVSLRPGSHDLMYEKGKLKYMDSYVGGERFVGEEVLFQDEVPVWSMNYAGRTLEDSFSGDFLKEALLLRSCKKPYRGPDIYTNGSYTYHCNVTGDFTWFQGSEEIFYGNLKVYECIFHGGIVR
ncbi:MAG: helix-turn-helix transcriptional regulator [Candidatus Galacturonibacter soehngenii]|nr:helix-turn-helix transcriptional regulator [Candidatus Galacturonibacter soehngenii]